MEFDSNKDDKLYNTLISELTFLRNELSSKDAIIKMLLNDHNCEKYVSNTIQDNRKKSIDNAPNKSEIISTGHGSVTKYTNMEDIEKRNEGEFNVVTH